MVVRTLPYSDALNPAAGLVDPAFIGHATGNTDYALVSHYGKRLYIGQANTYTVFINDNADQSIYHFEWIIRRFDFLAATWLNENLLDANAAIGGPGLEWTPTQDNGEGRYEITVRIYNDTNADLATCRLIQQVFTGFSLDELQNEVNATASVQNRILPNAAGLGDPLITQSIIAKYWEYTIQESYRANNADDLINPSRLCNIIYSFHAYYLANRGTVDATPLFVAATNMLSGNYRHAYQGVNLCIVGMLCGLTTWRDKGDDPNTWGAVETLMQADFDALTLEQQMHLYNLLKFPKSLVRFVADAVIAINSHLQPGASEQDLNRNLVKYFSFNAPESDLEALNTLSIPFTAAVLSVPNFALRSTPAYHIDTIAQNNLDLNDQGQDVLDIKEDLNELGFTLVLENIDDDNPANGNQFNIILEWAVREFQIYAKMKFLARVREDHDDINNLLPYHQRLRRTPNLLRYTGSVSGVANEETRRLIKLWKVLKWRCPVVVGVFADTVIDNVYDQPTNLNRNVWRFNKMADDNQRGYGGFRTKVQDFSGYWNGNNAGNNIYFDNLSVLGFSAIYNALNGPGNYRMDCLNQDTNVFQNILPVSAPVSDTRTIIQSVIAVELGATPFFENINCYDNAILSLGYLHWTIGTGNGAGELLALLTLLKSFNDRRPAFEKIMTNNGLNTNEEWTANNNALWNTGTRTYSAYFSYQLEDFSWDHNFRQNTNGYKNYHRTWHSFYRWVLALRNLTTPFAETMWALCRIRLIDVLSKNWTNAGTGAILNTNDGSAIAGLTFYNIFRSTRSIALILRWHTNSPGTFYPSNDYLVDIQTVVHNAMAGQRWGHPDTWTDANEIAICNALVNAIAQTTTVAYSSLRNTIPLINANNTLNTIRFAADFQVNNVNLPVAIHN